MSLLAIERLRVRYGPAVALDDVSLRVAAGEIVGLVGRSGSGKSTLALAALALLPPETRVEGRITVEGVDLARSDARALRRVRGGRVGFVFQEPATALNPALTIGRQVGEAVAAHRLLAGRAIAAEVRRLLDRVGLDVDPARYPHMLSGGQRQRVGIAMAIAGGPALLIADEPTAALDPLARAGIVHLLGGLVRERGMGLLLVSHDLSLVARVADRIAVLEEGRLVEEGPAAERLRAPRSPTLAAMSTAERGGDAPPPPSVHEPLLAVRDLVRTFASGSPFARRRTTALAGVSLDIATGETLAVVGGSGSGKTTLARLVLGLDRPDAGSVALGGQTWGRGERALRRQVQAVFQDPADSLDPMMTVERIVAEPLHLLESRLSPSERAGRVADVLARVGLGPAVAARRPDAFSGGQRQRIALARALILRPRLVVLDEALSALDPELRVEMADLLRRLQAGIGLAYLFVAHDMTLVRRLAHRVMVLRDGLVVEEGVAADLLDRPRDPYTAALVAASPTLEAALLSRPGSPPSAPIARASPPQ